MCARNIIGFLLVVWAVYSFVAVVNHDRFQTYGLDLGTYDQLVWLYSRGENAISTIVEGRPSFAIHFHPILWMISPLFWIWNDVRALLILQAFVLVVAAFPLFLLAQSVLKNNVIAFAIAMSYLFFFGTQFAAFLDFHSDSFLPLFFALAILFLHRRQTAGFLLMLLLLLTIKDWVGFLIISLGVTIVALRQRLLGLVTISVGAFGFLLAAWVMGQASLGLGKNIINYGFGKLGAGPSDVIVSLLTHPWLAVQYLFYPFEKVGTIWSTMWPFGPFALAAPAWLIPVVEQFAHRFYDLERPVRWGIHHHYSLPMGMLLAIATIYGVERLSNMGKQWIPVLPLYRWSSRLLIALIVLQMVVFHVPILSLFKLQFYQEPTWIHDTRAALALIPPNVSVVTQNNLAPHLSHRQEIFLLGDFDGAAYAVFDTHPGQSLYNSMMQSEEEMVQFVNDLRASGEWEVLFDRGDTVVMKRKGV